MTWLNRRKLLKGGLALGAASCARHLLACDEADEAGSEPRKRSTEQTHQHSQKGATRVDNGPQISTFLMFAGQAEEAMNFYLALFENSKVIRITRYGPEEMSQEGSVQLAVFSLNGREFMCFNSPTKHDFTFTPAISLFVSCSDEAKITRYFEALSEGGQVLMPLDRYPFSKKFGWVQDRFGVSWQLNFES